MLPVAAKEGGWAALSEEATLERVGEEIAKAQSILGQDRYKAGAWEDVSGAVVTEAVNVVVALRETLAGNDCVRISDRVD